MRYMNVQVLRVLLVDYSPSMGRWFINRHAVLGTAAVLRHPGRERWEARRCRGWVRATMDQKFLTRSVPAGAGIWSRGSELLKSSAGRLH